MTALDACAVRRDAKDLQRATAARRAAVLAAQRQACHSPPPPPNPPPPISDPGPPRPSNSRPLLPVLGAPPANSTPSGPPPPSCLDCLVLQCSNTGCPVRGASACAAGANLRTGCAQLDARQAAAVGTRWPDELRTKSLQLKLLWDQLVNEQRSQCVLPPLPPSPCHLSVIVCLRAINGVRSLDCRLVGAGISCKRSFQGSVRSGD